MGSTMKLLIVLGLFPLFSAQQYGSFSQGFNNNLRSGFDFNSNNNNNNNLWSGFDFNNNNNNQWAGFDFNSNSNSNLGYSSRSSSNVDLSLDSLNADLIQQLRFMTNSLASMLKQVAKDPRANEVFKVMDKICVSNMDETIEILKVGSNAAEKALLEADKVLDDAVKGLSGGSQRSYNRPQY